jgi:hypothetical protein
VSYVKQPRVDDTTQNVPAPPPVPGGAVDPTQQMPYPPAPDYSQPTQAYSPPPPPYNPPPPPAYTPPPTQAYNQPPAQAYSPPPTQAYSPAPDQSYAQPPAYSPPGPPPSGQPGAYTPPGSYAPPAAYAQAGPGQPPYPGQAGPGTSGLAIVSLIAAFLIPPIGAILGFVALPGTGRGKRKGRGLAVAGIILGILFTLGWTGVIIGTVLLANRAQDVVEEQTTGILEQGLQDQLNDTLGDLPSDFPSDLGLPTDIPTGDLSGIGEGAQDSDMVARGEIPDFSGDFEIGAVSGGLLPTADVTITNSSDVSYTYFATLSITAPDGSEVEGAVLPTTVEPGQSVTAQAFFTPGQDIPDGAVPVLLDYARSPL